MKERRKINLLPSALKLLPSKAEALVKRITNAALGYKSFHTAWRTIRGIEIMRMIYKGQVEGVNSKDVLAMVRTKLSSNNSVITKV